MWFKAKMLCALMGLALSSSCSVGTDLSGKHFSCSSAEDCFDGTYCEPTLGICLHPDEDVKSFLDNQQSDAGPQEDASDEDFEAVAQDPGPGNSDANPIDPGGETGGDKDGSQD